MLFGLIDAVNVVCLYSSVSAVNMQCYMLYAVQREECEGDIAYEQMHDAFGCVLKRLPQISLTEMTCVCMAGCHVMCQCGYSQ